MFANSSSVTAVHQVSRSQRQVTKPVRHRPSTTEAYSKDVARFVNRYGGTIPCSADELISYIVLLSKRVAPATIARRCMALQDAHIRAGHPSPTADPRVREALRWLTSGQQPVNLIATPKNGKAATPTPGQTRVKKRSAKPITRPLLHRMLDIGTGMRTLDRRDKAILLLGFIGGLKRSTIAALNIEDLAWTEDAMLIHVGLRADDDEGRTAKGRVIALPFTRGPLCAATAVRQWLEHNDLVGRTGPLFPRFTRSGEPVLDQRLDSAYISILLKQRLLASGITDVSEFSGESLRRGHELETLKVGRS